jgi:hypothetical protein
MSFILDRKYKMERVLFDITTNNPNKVGFSFIFNKEIKEVIVYQIIENKYLFKKINETTWSNEKYIYDLTWLELKEIIQTIQFVEPEELDSKIDKIKKSFLLKIKQMFVVRILLLVFVDIQDYLKNLNLF